MRTPSPWSENCRGSRCRLRGPSRFQRIGQSGIPILPLLCFGAYRYEYASIKWILATMATCISAEGFIHRYMEVFDYPFLASATASFLSFAPGIPPAIIAIPTQLFISPTIASFITLQHQFHPTLRAETMRKALDKSCKFNGSAPEAEGLSARLRHGHSGV